ncbi:permease prefix domain 1-containing protein [Microbacterium sp. ARD32]|uniref:HAAS signaling domain-containing protein n=1 Tax=Microbacterium sp. ARD32 TaxID=2962577 RepID=UPI0028811D38|nr:permease prefix domain 1-containing protein [Microbacterium sp. ARD32]MDT0156291.1 permease prefix domain 1-containing protein [Microbacterium sp. ARD32]
MTATADYAERYLAAVSRALPASSRPELLAEVESSIAEQVEPRVARGESREDAERHVVAALGEPIAYASSLIDRPMWLIGPRYYAAWLRLLRLLLVIVPLCAVGGSVLGQLIARASVGEVIGSTVAVLIGTIVHVAFWTTLVFFVLERTGSTGESVLDWSPDQLPLPAEHRAGRNELIGSLVFLALVPLAMLWDVLLGFFPTGAAPVPVLMPSPWTWTVILGFVVLEAVFAVVLFLRRRWSMALAVVNTVLAVGFAAASLTLLIRGALVNPEFMAFVTRAGGDGFAQGEQGSTAQGGVFGILAAILGFCLIAFPAWDIADGWLKLRRAGAGGGTAATRAE